SAEVQGALNGPTAIGQHCHEGWTLFIAGVNYSTRLRTCRAAKARSRCFSEYQVGAYSSSKETSSSRASGGVGSRSAAKSLSRCFSAYHIGRYSSSSECSSFRTSWGCTDRFFREALAVPDNFWKLPEAVQSCVGSYRCSPSK